MEVNLHTKLGEYPNFTLLEFLMISNKLALSKKPTINKKELSEITGKPIKRINALINNKIIPERLIVGGYDARKQRTTMMFFTKEVLEWLKGDNNL